MSKPREPASHALYRHEILSSAEHAAHRLSVYLGSLARAEKDIALCAEAEAVEQLARRLEGELSALASAARAKALGRMR